MLFYIEVMVDVKIPRMPQGAHGTLFELASCRGLHGVADGHAVGEA